VRKHVGASRLRRGGADSLKFVIVSDWADLLCLRFIEEEKKVPTQAPGNLFAPDFAKALVRPVDAHHFFTTYF
jgi:hypothetical protein